MEPLPLQKMQLGLHDIENKKGTIQRAAKINRAFVDGPWCTWSHIPHDVRRQMWEHFQGFYMWDPTLDAKMQEIWERKCSKKYNDNLSFARTRAAKLSNLAGHPYDVNDPYRDINLLKPYHPDWLSPTIWITMIDHWNNEHWKNVSLVSHKNHMTEDDGEISKHSSGSIYIGVW